MMDRTTDLRNASAAKLDVTTGANELGQKIDVATGVRTQATTSKAVTR